MALRLFLPKEWADVRPRLQRAGVQCGTVLADAGHSGSAAFRQALSDRYLRWAVGIGGSQKVCPAHVRLRTPRPRATGQRPRRHPIPSPVSRSAATVLATARGQAVSWRTGTRGPMHAKFAAVHVGSSTVPERPERNICRAPWRGWWVRDARMGSASTF